MSLAAAAAAVMDNQWTLWSAVALCVTSLGYTQGLHEVGSPYHHSEKVNDSWQWLKET
jgi:hypothetical protein